MSVASSKAATMQPVDLFAQAPYGVVLLTDDGLVAYANPTAAAILGRGTAILDGEPLVAVVPTAWVPPLASLLGGWTRPTSPRAITLPGDGLGTTHRLTFVPAAEGVLLTISQSLSTILQTADLATVVAASGDHAAGMRDGLADLISRSPDVVARFDRDLRFLSINEAVRAFSDVVPADLVGRPFEEMRFFAGDADVRYLERLRQVFATGVEANHVDSVVTERGEFILHARLIPEPGNDGRPASVLVITRDVTALVHEHFARVDMVALNRTLLDSVPDCVTVVDRAGVVVSINAGGRRLLEIDPDAAVVGESWSLLWPASAHPMVAETVAGAFERTVGTFVTLAPTFQGNQRWWEVVVAPVVTPEATTQHVIMIARDITEAHAARQELQVSRARFQRLYDANVLGMVFANLDGTLVDANPAYLSMTGLRRADLLAGRVTMQSITPSRYQGKDRGASEVLRSLGVCEPYEKEIHRPDGTLVHILVGGAATPGDIADAIYYVVDLTALRAAQTELRERERQLALVLTAGTIGLWWGDLTTGEMHWTDEYRAIMHLPSNEPPNLTAWRERVHPEDRDPIEREFADALRERTVFDVEYRLLLDDGSVRWVRSTGRTEYDADGTPLRSSGLLIDVTERNHAEHDRIEALQRERDAQGIALAAEAQFRSLFDGAAESILVADNGGQFIAANPGAEELLGYSALQLTAMCVQDISPRGHELLGSPPRGGQPSRVRSGEHEVLRRGGEAIRVESRSRAVRAADGGVLHYISLRDISERRMLEQLHQELIDSISHDLKNPLAAIKAQAQLLRRRVEKGRLDEAYLSEAMASINNSVERMTGQLDDLLEVARLRAGAPLELRRSVVDLGTLVAGWVAEYQRTTERHILSLDPIARPVVCSVDVNRIERVVTNLLSNAIKYSDGGVIRVAVALEGAVGSDEEVVIAVTDQGLGIPDEELGAVFERFRRGSNVEGRAAGSGIGLAGVRQIVQQHGGTIGVESTVGVGSTFTVRLPREDR